MLNTSTKFKIWTAHVPSEMVTNVPTNIYPQLETLNLSCQIWPRPLSAPRSEITSLWNDVFEKVSRFPDDPRGFVTAERHLEGTERRMIAPEHGFQSPAGESVRKCGIYLWFCPREPNKLKSERRDFLVTWRLTLGNSGSLGGEGQMSRMC